MPQLSRHRRGASQRVGDALRQAARMVRSAQTIAAVTHIAPDPDAIGSLLSFGNAMSSNGKTVILLCDDGVPQSLRYIPGAIGVVDSLPANATPDLVVALDSSDPARLGTAGAELLKTGIPSINFDHHVTNLLFGTVNVVNAEWAATAEGLADLFDVLRWSITPDIATGLLTGIVGDTQSFSTSNTTSATFEIAARLTSAGADLQFVTAAIFNNRSVDVLRLWGLGLSNLTLEAGVVWTAMSQAERSARGVQDTNGSGLSNLLISAQEANIAAVFTEQPDGSIDLSMRAKPEADVAQIALSLGGGGHTLAAGAKLYGPLDQTVSHVVGLLKASLTATNIEN